MPNNKIKGESGEKIAAEYLKKKGYVIIDKNFKTNVGELDIVALDNDCLVFVEVKTRMSDKYGAPSEAVTAAKQKKISQVAAQFINKYRYFDLNIRFDIIEIRMDLKEINHIENAFDSCLRY